MRVGIIGFRGSGKTTVFNALTGLEAVTGFGGGGKPNLGTIKVPDERIDFLAERDRPKKVTFAEIAFVDVPGAAPSAGAGGSGGLDPALVEQVRDTDALVLVVRAFANPGLDQDPDPVSELDALIGELVLTDQIAVENRLARIHKEGNKAPDLKVMEIIHAALDQGQPIFGLDLAPHEHQATSGFRFLTAKPLVALINCETEAASAPLPAELTELAAKAGATIMPMAAEAEAEIAELKPEEQAEFSAELGLAAPARARFIQTVFARLDLISFLTRGPDECRAWPIPRGTTARAAAGAIHSDLERGFIRAEVIAFTDFERLGSEAKCREAGLLRVEGKSYVVQDGDLLHIRFNV